MSSGIFFRPERPRLRDQYEYTYILEPKKEHRHTASMSFSKPEKETLVADEACHGVVGFPVDIDYRNE